MTRCRQISEEACGATALLCAANELGVDNMPTTQILAQRGVDEHLYGSLYRVGVEGQPLMSVQQDGFARSDLSEALYSVTAARQINGNGDGYSLPQGIARCVRYLGLHCVVRYESLQMVGTLIDQIHKEYNVNVLQQLLSDRVTVEIPFPNHQPAYWENIGNNWRSIEVVIPKLAYVPIGLHYVLRRPNTVGPPYYMDPATGEDYDNFRSMSPGAVFDSPLARAITWYKETGISIFVTPVNF